MLTERAVGRLQNYKFASAASELTYDATKDERELVEALARMFGNVGWFDGDMATLVDCTVESLLRHNAVLA
jgi:hypothetical protein